jgi:hypothetical protein
MLKQANNRYRWGRTSGFREAFKYWFYAWAYGSAQGKDVHDDFYTMYDMGQEL